MKLFCTAWRHGLTEGAPAVQGRSATCYLSGVVQHSGPPAMMLRVRQQFNDYLRDHPYPSPSSSGVPSSLGASPGPGAGASPGPGSSTASPCPGAGASPCPCSSTASPCLRVITYNTLAEPFAISDYAVKSMFQYCPLPYLETEYRLQMVLQELLTYQGDMICLQVTPLRASLVHEPSSDQRTVYIPTRT